jgi:hypothetical protein
VRENAVQGDASSVWHAIDDFSRASFLMNVGDAKGDIVEEEIVGAKPKVKRHSTRSLSERTGVLTC